MNLVFSYFVIFNKKIFLIKKYFFSSFINYLRNNVSKESVTFSP